MSEEKKRKPIKLIDDPSELPTDLSDEEQLEFWETHGLSQEFLDKTEQVPADERPRPREKTTPISVRFDAHTLDRLKALADRRGVGYQTLLKQFVGERLYEEEKRAGLVPADNEADLEEVWQATFKDTAERARREMAGGAASWESLTRFLAESHDAFFGLLHEQLLHEEHEQLRRYRAVLDNPEPYVLFRLQQGTKDPRKSNS